MNGQIVRALALGILLAFGCAVSSDDGVELGETVQDLSVIAIDQRCEYPKTVTDCESCNGYNTCMVCCTKLPTSKQALCNANCEDLWPPKATLQVETDVLFQDVE
jgi:hypothetical protein